jgi:hypothetical protein
MSLLTPQRIPIGFAPDRRRAAEKLSWMNRTFSRFSRVSNLIGGNDASEVTH